MLPSISLSKGICSCNVQILKEHQWFFYLAENFQFSTWKIWFQSMQRSLHEKNGPNPPDFESSFSKSPDFYDKFQ
jgi:hypothetical protein